MVRGDHGLRLCQICEQAWPKALGDLPLPGLSRFALWPYEGTVRRLLVQAKDMPYCAQAWALRRAALAARVPLVSTETVWCVTPPSRRRRWSAWYLPKFVAESLARSHRCQFRSLLVRKQQRGNQSDLSGAERRANLQGVFRWRGGLVPKTVVIFDDVSTTGATLKEAARALREAGVQEVITVCLAAVE
ncbi:MAG: phosphoribosyltransferase family protein [Planctomycetota bacterium]|nr:phosphoribosyltransferase family protein [Planctomycetota bacterium]MDA1114454.1 phosphoribosyltransferase family protein [Planctomycetota bacterium]